MLFHAVSRLRFDNRFYTNIRYDTIVVHSIMTTARRRWSEWTDRPMSCRAIYACKMPTRPTYKCVNRCDSLWVCWTEWWPALQPSLSATLVLIFMPRIIMLSVCLFLSPDIERSRVPRERPYALRSVQSARKVEKICIVILFYFILFIIYLIQTT